MLRLDRATSPGAQYFAAGLAEKTLRAVLLLWAARVEGPEGMAGWNFYSLLLVFGGVVQLGQVNGLRRELPRLTSPSSPEWSPSALIWSGAGVAAVVPTLLLITFLIAGLPAIAWATACALLGQTVLQVSNAVHVARLSFVRAAAQQMASAAALVVCCWSLVPRWGVTGYAGALAISGLGAALAVPSWGGKVPSCALMFEGARYLARSGAWPLLVGIAFWLPSAVDRALIAVALGREALGLYTLAIHLGAAMMWVRSGIAEQWYPKIALAISTGESRRAVLAIARRQLRVSLQVTTAALAGALVIGWPAVVLLLPAYRGGLAAALAVGLAGVVLVVNQAAANVLHALRRSRECFQWQAVGSLATVGLVWVALRVHPALWLVPAAAGVASLLLGIMLWQLAQRRLASHSVAS